MNTTIADELVAALEGDSTICDLLWDRGENEARIYPQSRVQDNRKQLDRLPAIIYGRQGQSEPRAAEDGESLTRQAWGIVCYAGRYDELERLAEAVIAVLSDPANYGPRILELIVAGQDDDFEDETNTHERQIDLSVLAWS